MQSTLHRLAFAFCLSFSIFYYHTSAAQCTSRYLDTAFSTVDSFPNVTYTATAGGNTPELMDIYQPHGDSTCLRHLVIFLHGGAFFQGSKNDGDMEFLCHRFAQRGYVAVTINYRLAPNLAYLYDSNQIFKYAYEAMSDLKAAVRYFYKDAALTNQWNIDTNAIFIGGSSAGAIAADFAATLDSVSEIDSAFQSIAIANGGIDGNSGNAGYSTKVNAVASLAGAVNSLSWIKASTPPTVFCQGTADGTIPYDCGLALLQYTYGLYHTINFCGSGEMAPKMDSLGIHYSLLPFQGSGHVPWDTNSVIANRMDSAVAAFFYSVHCAQAPGSCTEPQMPNTSSIDEISNIYGITIYPNPANDIIHISSRDQDIETVTLYDYTGKEIIHQPTNNKNAILYVKNLSAGIYSLRIDMKDASTIYRKAIVQ
jgi:hypothetical protein